MNPPVLRFGLLAGSACFVCMAIAHFFGIKQPLLFVYYDTPFHAYQDRIISFSVVAYAALFHAASNRRDLVPTALFVLTVTIAGLVSVTLSDALASVMAPGQSTGPYWLQIAAITLYLVFLFVAHRRSPSVSVHEESSPGSQQPGDSR